VKVCVYGAGAIGGHLAGRLSKGGAEVSVVARGAHLAAMQRDGLVVHAQDGEIHAPVAASDDPRQLGPQDCVIVAVKAPALASVAAGIGPLLGPETSVVFAMNGVPWFYFHRHGGPLDGIHLPRIDPGDLMWNAVGPERAIAGIVYSACSVSQPGHIHVEGRSRLVLGEPDGSVSARATAIADVLRAGGITMDVSPRMRDEIWRKLLLNMITGPLCVLGQANLNDAHVDPETQAAGRAMLAEGLALAKAMGCDINLDADKVMAANKGVRHKPSILQDLELGRPMEIDALYVTPLELAKRLNVPMPVFELLVALTKVRARSAGLYAG
jgi:2-dehydropantoate 2-reductase